MNHQSQALFTPLQLCLKSSYAANHGNAMTCNQNQIRELENETFVMGDLDIRAEEIPFLCKFMTSREALMRVQKLVVSRKVVPSTTPQRKSTTNQPLKPAALEMNKGKLQYAIVDFIARSHRLHSVVFDGITLKPELFAKLGQALSSKKGDLRLLSFKNVPMRSAGLRALSSHIGRSAVQQLVLERCLLDDAAGPYVSSILKAQEARLDQLYWNSTLRLDPEECAHGFNEQCLGVYSDGLVLLSLAGNAIGEAGLQAMTRSLETNHWLLGLNLANNAISHDGIEEFAAALEQNTALHACLLVGNPGLTLRAVEAVSAVTSAAEQRLDLLPERLARTLRTWLKAQAGEAYSFDPSQSHSAGPGGRGGDEGDEGMEDEEPAAEVRGSLASFAASDEAPALPWGRKKGGKTPPLLGQAHAGNHNGRSHAHPLAHGPTARAHHAPRHANGHEMDREDEAFQGGDRAAGKVQNFDGDDISGRDSLEFAIPTPTSGSDFQGSPELSVRVRGDFYQQGRAEGGSDGRPPSRNSLRPRVVPTESTPTPRPAKTVLRKPSLSAAGALTTRPHTAPLGQANTRYASTGARWPEGAAEGGGREDRRAASAGGTDTRMRARRSGAGPRAGKKAPADPSSAAQRDRQAAAAGAHMQAAAQARAQARTSATGAVAPRTKLAVKAGLPKAVRRKRPVEAQLMRKLDTLARSIDSRMSRLEESVSETVLSMSMQRDASASFSSHGEGGLGSPLLRRSAAAGPSSSSPGRHAVGSSSSSASSPASPASSRLALHSYASRSSPSAASSSPQRGHAPQLSPSEMEGLIRNTMREKLRDFIHGTRG